MILVVLRSAGFSVSYSAVLLGIAGFRGLPSDSGVSMGAALTHFPAFGFGLGFDDDDDSSDSRSATRPCLATVGFGRFSFSVANFNFNLPRFAVVVSSHAFSVSIDLATSASFPRFAATIPPNRTASPIRLLGDFAAP
jgi:hypothetical protein